MPSSRSSPRRSAAREPDSDCPPYTALSGRAADGLTRGARWARDLHSRSICPGSTLDRRRPSRKRPRTGALRGGETVLVVEDQEAVRELTKTVLEAYGYRVFEATNGDEALAFVKQHSDEIHLLLTDVILPGMNGKDLSERLRRLRPKLKVLFTSGYTAEVVGRRGVTERDLAYLPKPVSPETLVAKVRDVLG